MAEIEKFGLAMASLGAPAQFLAAPPDAGKSSGALLGELEGELEQYERQLLELNRFSEKLTQEYSEKIELHEVLMKSRDFFNAVPDLTAAAASSNGAALAAETAGGRPLLDEDFGLVNEGMLMRGGTHAAPLSSSGRDNGDMRFQSMTGILPDAERARFERALFRSTRGNCYVRFADIAVPMDDGKGAMVAKVVFIVFYKSRAIEAKARRIADAFGARRYSVPEGGDGGRALEAALQRNRADIADARTVLIKNREMRHVLCRDLAGLAQGWLWSVLREKAVFATLNCLKPDVSGMLRGEGWVTAESVPAVRAAIEGSHAAMALGGACVVSKMRKPWPDPPTCFKLNAFTTPYQVRAGPLLARLLLA